MTSLAQALEFTNRRVLITGGGRGIGKAAVKAFVELNASVFVLEKNEELIQKLKEEYPNVTAVQVDLRNWDATREAIKPLLPIHHLVNNAGVCIGGSILGIKEEFVNMYLDINFKQVLNVSELVAQGMIENSIKGGTIVNISSVLDRSITATGAAVAAPMYGCTKASVTMLTKFLALELAPHGIRVNAIRPGAVNTEIFGVKDPEVLNKILGPTLNRMVLSQGPLESDEIVKGIVFLSSELSSSMTGSALTIDAGYDIF